MMLGIIAGLPCTAAAAGTVATPDRDRPETPASDTFSFSVTLDEATWMSVDVSPDDRMLAVDILGDIYLVPAAGGKARRLTSGPAFDQQPRFSPDGRHLVFLSDRSGGSEIWVIGADGRNAHAISAERTATFSSPDWTPDGEYIVVSRHDDNRIDGAHALYLYPREGGAGTELVDRSHGALGASASPDDQWIYFSRTTGIESSSIERVHRQSGRIEAVVAADQALRPAVSPDGKWLAFGRRDDNQSRLALRHLESGTERILDLSTDHPFLHPLSDVDRLPGYAFSPDGKAIYYAANGKIRRHDIAADASGIIPFEARVRQTLRRPVRVALPIDNEPVRPRMLRWTHAGPDGRWLYFGAAGKIYRHDPRTGATEPVADGPGLEYAPAISPDGRELAYVSWSDREFGRLCTFDLDQGRARCLTPPGLFESPAWSPDGRKLVYLQSSGGERRNQANLNERAVKRLHWISVEDGRSRLVTTLRARGDRRQAMRPGFNGDGTRIWFTETPVRRQPTYLASARLDGSDRRRHLEFADADDVMPSPDGKWVAFTEQFETYLAAMPTGGIEPVRLGANDGDLPVHRLSDGGGAFLNWSRDSREITWGWGPAFHRATLASVIRPGNPDRQQANSTNISFTEAREVGRGRLLLRNARLVTMSESGVIPRGDILVEDDRILAVGPAGSIAAAGAETLDLDGATIIPGLVDLHMHYRESYDTEVFPQQDWGYVVHLAYGVTTARNPSARSQAVFTQAEMIETGRSLGPRIFSTGEPLYFVRLPFARPVQSLADARNQVLRLKQLGALGVKQYRQPRRQQRQWIVQAAREQDMQVVGEGAWKIFHNLTVVMDGHTTLEHAFKTGDVYADIRALMRASGIYYTPTLFVSQHGTAGDYFYQQSDVFLDERLLRFMPYEWLAQRARRRMKQPEEDYFFVKLAEASAALHRDGANVGFGAHGNLLGLGAHWEMWALAMGGLSPLEVLRTATLNSAEALGAADDIGSLSAGKIADLVVLNENPLDDIRSTAAIRFVMKNGIAWNAATMDQVWPEKAAFPGFYWKQRD